MSHDKWDERYLEMAALVARWSKDPNARVGAVIVRNNRVVATGFNGFPCEVLDKTERLNHKALKLEMTVHAEENALIVAGRSAEGATIYVHGKPVCPRCAGSIIQAGIARVVAMDPKWILKRKKNSRWGKLGLIALDMFLEARIQFHDKIHTKPKKRSSKAPVRTTRAKVTVKPSRPNGNGRTAATSSNHGRRRGGAVHDR